MTTLVQQPRPQPQIICPGTPARGSGRGLAMWMLILATALWGAGFTWAKDAQQAINLAGPGLHATLGPLWFLGLRFLVAGLLWLALFPAARRGWSTGSVRRSVVLGALLAVGMILQHLGLDRSSEAVTAFLTTLSIVFVPVLSATVLRRPPRVAVWVGVAVAMVGVWRMTGGAPRGFGLGELFGVACAVVFSVHILALNVLVPRDSPMRLNGGQFLVIGLICLVAIPFDPASWAYLSAGELWRVTNQPVAWTGLALMVLLPTLGAFSLMTFFQPKLDPTRAALIYLVEPIWAGAFAWVIAGRAMTGAELQGAAIILAANAIVELLSARRRG